MSYIITIFWLVAKEVRSVGHDRTLMSLMIFAFSVSILVQAHSDIMELRNASIGVVDEDHSPLSRHIVQAFLPPYFKASEDLRQGDIKGAMDIGRFTFIVDIPPNFQRDIAGGRRPAMQLTIDGTAMIHAGIGSGYVDQIIQNAIRDFRSHRESAGVPAVDLVLRIAFNPNVLTSWFVSVMALVNNITMLGIVLTGAAVIRERERGTMDHLLAMPLTPFEIAISKMAANAAIIVIATALSILFVIRRLLDVPIAGSLPLFLAALLVYLFFATSVGIFLSTIVRSMPQFGLLFMIVDMPMYLLSGAYTPLESMPLALRSTMQLVPSTHFVAVAEAVLCRGAGFELIWQDLVMIGLVGAVLFGFALLRFRRAITSVH